MNALDAEKVMHYNDLVDKFFKSLDTMYKESTVKRISKFELILEKLSNSSSIDEFNKSFKKTKKELSNQEKEIFTCLFDALEYYCEEIILIDFSNNDFVEKDFMAPAYLRYMQRKSKSTYTKLFMDSGVSEETIKHLFAPRSMQNVYSKMKKETFIKLSNALHVKNPEHLFALSKKEANRFYISSLRATDDEVDRKEEIEDLLDNIEKSSRTS